MIFTSDFWSVLTQALGWTLVHSIWQISLIFLIFKSFSWIYQRYNRIGYASALVAMAAAVIWSGITFSSEYQRIQSMAALYAEPASYAAAAQNGAVSHAVPVLLPVPLSREADLKDSLLNWLEEQSALFGWIWFLGVATLFLRLSGGYWLARRLRRRGTSAPEQHFADMCQQWSDRLGIRRNIQLLESKYITEPLTLGFWKPVILFPAGMLLHLSPAQVEALLLHELAHVRRYDYLVNLIQLSLDTFFFYHPLFWLISREARRRREYCCDDTVLRYTDDRLEYARTLTEIKLHPVHLQNPFAMTSIGKDNFSIRILRIAGINAQRSSRSGLILLVLLLMGITTIVGLPAITKAATPEKWITYPDPVQHPENKITALPENSTSDANSLESNKPNLLPDNNTLSLGRTPENLIQPSLSTPDSLAPAGPVAIELNKMNVCYAGVDNPMYIAVDGVPSAELIVRLKGEGKISGNNGQYMAQFSQPGSAKVEVFHRRNGSEVLLASKEYRIKRIPDPVPVLCGKKGGLITAEELLSCKEISALLTNFDFDAFFEITGFEITLVPSRSDPIAISVSSNMIPESMLENIKQLSAGGTIFFDDIKVKCTGDQAPRNIGAMSFKIKMKE